MSMDLDVWCPRCRTYMHAIAVKAQRSYVGHGPHDDEYESRFGAFCTEHLACGSVRLGVLDDAEMERAEADGMGYIADEALEDGLSDSPLMRHRVDGVIVAPRQRARVR